MTWILQQARPCVIKDSKVSEKEREKRGALLWYKKEEVGPLRGSS